MRNLILTATIFLLLAMGGACTSDGDYTKIDFSDTVPGQKPENTNHHSKRLRVAVAAMISPKETFVFYKELMNFLGESIQMDIQMVQRKTYKEINELFPRNSIDLAFICSGPYALEKETYQFQAIATPVVRGSPFYQSYLIVNKQSEFQKLSDLQQHTFAFSDPNSNTGSLVPTFWLSTIGYTPESFFSKTHYTYSHDNSILTVAKNLVDGAAVDGHKWEYFQARNDINTSKTRVIKKSAKFGSPPVVASGLLPTTLQWKIQNVLLTMHTDANGKRILDNLLIDRFTEPKEEWYQTIRKMKIALSETGRTP